MSSNKSWKDHERSVAKYFNTKRRVRGQDFGISDIEVLADVEDWLGWECKVSLAVECKYSKKFTIHTHYINQQGVKPLILNVGDFYIVNLEYFSLFMEEIVLFKAQILDLKFDIIRSDKKNVQYLQDYRAQALKYATVQNELGASLCVPIACLAKASCQTKLVSIHYEDLQTLVNHYEEYDCKCVVTKNTN